MIENNDAKKKKDTLPENAWWDDRWVGKRLVLYEKLEVIFYGFMLMTLLIIYVFYLMFGQLTRELGIQTNVYIYIILFTIFGIFFGSSIITSELKKNFEKKIDAWRGETRRNIFDIISPIPDVPKKKRLYLTTEKIVLFVCFAALPALTYYLSEIGLIDKTIQGSIAIFCTVILLMLLYAFVLPRISKK